MTASCPQILCIDADPSTSLWIGNTLREANFHCQISSVGSGREGFRRLNINEYDLCVLDYALPDMTGVELCALMQRMGSAVPMLFFTPMDRPVDRIKADAAGAAAYLVKPDELDLFVDTATHLIRRQSRMFAIPRRTRDFARAA